MSAREHRDIPIGLVDEPDAATRLTIDPAKIDELAASIVANGQLQPGGVVPHGERFTTIYGHRRLLACRKLQLPFYTAYVYASTTAAMLGAQLDENVIREDLNPVEEAYWFAQLLDALGVGTDDLAEKLHKTRDYVERRLLLLRGDEAVLDALKDGAINIGVAELLNSVPDESPRRMFLAQALVTHPTKHTVSQWIAEWRAAGAVNIVRSERAADDAPVDPTAFEDLKPRCAFCGGDEEPWTLKFEWVHSHCQRARDRMLDHKFEEGPVRHG